jgi:hypothetical protein
VESGENASQTSGKDKNKISEIKMKIVCLLADCDRTIGVDLKFYKSKNNKVQIKKEL